MHFDCIHVGISSTTLHTDQNPSHLSAYKIFGESVHFFPRFLALFDSSSCSSGKMRTDICRSASKAVKSLLSASRSSPLLHSETCGLNGRAVAAAAVTSFRGKAPTLASFYERAHPGNASRTWFSGALGLPAAEQEVHAAEISEIISRFECKGYKLVAIKIVIPSKELAQKHYHDLKERPFFNGLCDFLSSGPVIAMVWEGEGVIKYGRKLIGATDPQKSEPGTIRGDLAVVVGRNIIHGSDGPETAKDEINLWFKPEELVNYTSNAEKWVYGAN
ncbi:Nucleoside diphosphate kinase III, chloroplastic/mitochondrial [Asimina triloba]